MQRQNIKVMVACESSGRVREAFTQAGFNAISCDIVNTEIPGKHIIGRIEDINLKGYHLLIAFPPCTYLTICGNAWHNDKRQVKRLTAAAFVAKLFAAPVSHIAIENPVGILSTQWRQPSQIIHPWEYGHVEKKRTCLWLKALPKLQPVDIIEEHRRVNFVDKIPAGTNQKRIRSRTFQGIATAMARQWGDWLDKQYR